MFGPVEVPGAECAAEDNDAELGEVEPSQDGRGKFGGHPFPARHHSSGSGDDDSDADVDGAGNGSGAGLATPEDTTDEVSAEMSNRMDAASATVPAASSAGP